MPPLTDFLNAIFASDTARSRMRRFQFIMLAGFGWVVAAMIAHPPSALPEFLRALVNFITGLLSLGVSGSGGAFDAVRGPGLASASGALLLQVFGALFSPAVLRHGLALAFPVYLAFRLASAYLTDVFELPDTAAAGRFIRSAAFGGRPFTVSIIEGGLAPDDTASPVARIGGPGRVQVNLENLAIFEKIDGTPHVIPPTVDDSDPAEYLVAFERLRAVIDLRDQMTSQNELNVVGRTRDGVRIAARDVRVMYSILRAPVAVLNDPDRLPYTFQEPAVLSLVYEHTSAAWTSVAIDLIRRHLQRFIASHTLSEVLAAVGAPEIQSRLIHETAVRRQAETLYPGPTPDSAASAPLPQLGRRLVPRLALTDLFFSPSGGFQAEAARRGVQLHWIDVGTWALPNQIIAETQMAAWRLTGENELRRREQERLTSDSRAEELLRLVGEALLSGYTQQKASGLPTDDLAASLLFAYLGLLRSARDTYTTEDVPVPPTLSAAIASLSDVTQSYLEQNGKAKMI